MHTKPNQSFVCVFYTRPLALPPKFRMLNCKYWTKMVIVFRLCKTDYYPVWNLLHLLNNVFNGLLCIYVYRFYLTWSSPLHSVMLIFVDFSYALSCSKAYNFMCSVFFFSFFPRTKTCVSLIQEHSWLQSRYRAPQLFSLQYHLL